MFVKILARQQLQHPRGVGQGVEVALGDSGQINVARLGVAVKFGTT